MDDTLAKATNHLEQYGADRQLSAEEEALRQEALELLSRLATLEGTPADDPPKGFDSLALRSNTLDRLATDPVVFGSDPESGEWIAVSPDTLVSLDESQ